jgi:prepilin-type N-terminal cleavage/methylation domain-containing protein
MKVRSPLHPSPRRGLTLIELVVVLTILIALAGLLVPMLPSMLTRAHTSSCSTNMGETTKAINLYQALYSGYPSTWDALTDGQGTLINYLAGSNSGTAPANPTWPPGQGNGMANGEVTLITLANPGANGANEPVNLTGVGILYVQPMVATAGTAPGGPLNAQPFDPTFNYYVNTSNAAPPPRLQPDSRWPRSIRRTTRRLSPGAVR